MYSPLVYGLIGAAAYAGLRRLYDWLQGPRPPGTARATQSDGEAEHNPDLDTRLVALVSSGNKIAAIRDYRAATGVGLVEAKAYVEELEKNSKPE